MKGRIRFCGGRTPLGGNPKTVAYHRPLAQERAIAIERIDGKPGCIAAIILGDFKGQIQIEADGIRFREQ